MIVGNTNLSKDLKIAVIWSHVPDETDGIYVEVLVRNTPRSKFFDVVAESKWFPTIALCTEWALSKGVSATKIVEYRSNLLTDCRRLMDARLHQGDL